MTFTKWQRDRNKQGTFEQMVRALYATGLSYQASVDAFVACLVAESVVECEGNTSMAARRIGIARATLYRGLRKGEGFSVAGLRAMPKELVVGGREKEEAK